VALPPVAAAGAFVPRKAVSRPKAGLGHAKNIGKGSVNTAQGSNPTSSQPKGQDDFRKMLGGS
jgi:squamous cell carcinoma antigen recognized by T-cells 3